MSAPEDFTILIIEDDLLSRDILSEYLKELDFTVLVAENGFQGISKVQEFEPDLILLDIMMPRMNGYQFLSKLAEKRLDVPVIVTSAMSMLENVRKAMTLGANAYMVKPIDLNNLKDKLNRFLDLKLPVDKASNFNVKVEVEDKIIVITLEGELTIENLIPIRSEIVGKAQKLGQKSPRIIINFEAVDPDSVSHDTLKELFLFYGDLVEPLSERVKIITSNESIKTELKNHDMAKYFGMCQSLDEAYMQL